MSSTTDPGNKSPEEIERELEAERARLSRTTEALQDKLSIGSLVDEMMNRFQTHGGDFGRNFGRTVRDNPLPVALVAIGLGWMMAGGQDATDRRRGALGRFRGDDYDHDEYGDDREDSAYASMSGYRSRHIPPASGDDLPSGIPRRHADWDDDSPGLRDRAGDAASAVGEGLSGAARSAGHGVSSAVHSAGEGVSDAAGYASERARAAGRSISRGGSEAYGRARHYGRRTSDNVEAFVEEQPLVAAALSFAVGAAFGGLLPNSRAENRLMGEYAERTRQEAADALAEEGRKARRVAEAAVDEAGRMVDEAAGRADDSTPDGRSIVEKAEARAREAADRIGSAAEREAERQDLGGSVRRHGGD